MTMTFDLTMSNFTGYTPLDPDNTSHGFLSVEDKVISPDQVPYLYYVICGVYLSVVGTLGILLNGLVLFVFLRGKERKKTSNMYIINLAVADFLVSVLGFPFASISSFKGRWVFGSVGCSWYSFTVACTGLASICTMAGTALDRYCIIARMGYNRINSSYSRRLVSILAIWVYAIAWVTPPLFGINRYVIEGIGISCSYDLFTDSFLYRMFVLALFLGAFCLPLLVIVLSYTLLYTSIRRHEREMKETYLNEHHPKTVNRPNVEMAILRLSVLVVGLFCVCWAPYAIISVFYTAGYPVSSPFWTTLPAFFAKASAFCNPLVYVSSHPAVKQHLRGVFRNLMTNRNEERHLAGQDFSTTCSKSFVGENDSSTPKKPALCSKNRRKSSTRV